MKRTGPLVPPPGAPPRLSSAPFPPYSYVPRVTPHPVTDPAGHSFGVRDEPVELGGRRLPEDWREVDEYLFGIDLFNAAYFWEAHESWEAVWHAVARSSVTGRYLQGLIQTSASLLQRHCGREIGARNLRERSSRNLEPVHEWLEARGRSRYMGVELAAWEAAADAHLRSADRPFPFLVPTDRTAS